MNKQDGCLSLAYCRTFLF